MTVSVSPERLRVFREGSKSLRRIEKTDTSRRPHAITRVMSFTSGKGGVGKTGVVVNLAVALARRNRNVLILDADLGLANIDVMLGIKIERTLQDFFEGRATLEEIIVDGPEGISIIPAASGVESICNLPTEHKLLLTDAIEQLAGEYDYLLIDTRAGIDADVMYFNSASGEIVCIINPEPTSLTDAYALIKVLSREYGEKSICILSNNVSGEAQGQACFNRLSRAVERFLNVELRYLGFVPTDEMVRASIQEQRALLELFPSSPAAMALSALATRIDSEFLDRRVKGGMQFFFRQLLEAGVNG
ncbi:MAG: MinD/ParA family protein [Oligoflexia bacterium]|nr:MinD/ParA family protein [Oligoflexia bacterium]